MSMSGGGGMGGGQGDLIQMLIQAMQHQIQGGGNFANSIINQPGRPYGNAERGYDSHSGQWSQLGRGAGNAFNQRLGEMENGQNFYNNTMAGYNESPFARNQQQQGIRAANAFGSANGLSGSSALTNYAQQNAQDISSKDQQQYYNNRMGINQDYMNGQNTLMGYGHQSDMDSANFYGNAEYGKQRAEDNNMSNRIQSLLQMMGWA